jgi:hypothetical protein
VSLRSRETALDGKPHDHPYAQANGEYKRVGTVMYVCVYTHTSHIHHTHITCVGPRLL